MTKRTDTAASREYRRPLRRRLEPWTANIFADHDQARRYSARAGTHTDRHSSQRCVYASDRTARQALMSASFVCAAATRRADVFANGLTEVAGGVPQTVPGHVAVEPGVTSALVDGGRGVRAVIDAQRAIAIFLRKGELFAIDADCPHQGAGLELGDVEDSPMGPCISCPRHGWCFELRSGFCEDLDDFALRAYDVLRLPDGQVFVSTSPRRAAAR